MGQNKSYEPKDIATDKFNRKQKHDVCRTCGDKIDRRFGCACTPNDMELVRKAERRNEESLSGGRWGDFDSLQEYD